VGNVNCDYEDMVDVTDLTLLIDHLFINFTRLPNRNEANIDGSEDGKIDIQDLQLLIDYLFISFAELGRCPGPFNHPPETYVLQPTIALPYVNGVALGGPALGVPARWAARDIIDHPYEQPEFEYEWRLYGPYSDSLFEVLTDSFLVPVFVSNDLQVLRFGEGLIYEVCDTIPVPIYVDSSGFQITCDTLVIDTVTMSNAYGMIDTVFSVDDDSFIASDSLNRVAEFSNDGSGDLWVPDTVATMYNIFSHDMADTTRQMNFVFWVRSREADDTTVVDVTPGYAMASVIDPKFESPLMVIDMGRAASINRVNADSMKAYWQTTADNWLATLGEGYAFDLERDYELASQHLSDPDVLRRLLSHRVLVLLNDDVQTGVWTYQVGDYVGNIYRALDVGVNSWVAMRVPYGPGGVSYGEGAEPAIVDFPAEYQYYWGIERYRLSGWSRSVLLPFITGDSSLRIEEFVGADATDPGLWPDLVIDTARLHGGYRWTSPYYGWLDTVAALPEVNYADVSPGAEVLYTYVSRHGEASPLGYHGQPVMHRYQTEYFRTVHSLFTPYALETVAGQQMVNSVLDWLHMTFGTASSQAAPTSRPESGTLDGEDN